MNSIYNKIYDRYPDMFRRRFLSESESCMHWGICCGEGWCGIIDEMCSKLHKLFVENNLVDDKYPAAEQVKEKFGSLRFYIDFAKETDKSIVDEAYSIIREYEAKSESICDKCGEPAELSNINGWLATRCKNHARK